MAVPALINRSRPPNQPTNQHHKPGTGTANALSLSLSVSARLIRPQVGQSAGRHRHIYAWLLKAIGDDS